MKAWRDRPLEVANLLNPAFCSLALTAATSEYFTRSNVGMPYPIAFLILPITLHRPTRDDLPNNISTSLAAWIQLHPEAKVQFRERVVALEAVTRESIIFGANHQVLQIDGEGKIRPVVSRSRINRIISDLSGEASDCLRAARFTGRWLAASGSTTTTLALWGVHI